MWFLDLRVKHIVISSMKIIESEVDEQDRNKR